MEMLLADSGVHGQNRDRRYLIFGTEDMVRYLETCHTWYLDGTFKTAPKYFKQVDQL